ncbi:hypothetical protein ACHQM5_011472 [Ranunculus cassubicifolius]
MDSFTLTIGSRVNPFHHSTKKFNFFSVNPSRNTSLVVVSASSRDKDESKLENWELMELKFGRLLGEDPKLTKAKIAGRKANPDVSYMEIEKSFNKKNFQIDEFVEEFQRRPPPKSLNLVRPVPKKGVKFEEDISANKSFESQKSKGRLSSVGHVVDDRPKRPSVILRKPSSAYLEDDIEVKKSPRLTIKPNLSLKMGMGESRENFSDIMLLKRPEPSRAVIDPVIDNTTSGDSIVSTSGVSSKDSNNSYKPQGIGSFPQSELEDEPIVGLQPFERRGGEFNGNEASTSQSEFELQMKPPRFDQSSGDESRPDKEKAASLNIGLAENENFTKVDLQRKPPRFDESLTDEPKPYKDEAASFGNGDAETEAFAEVDLQKKPPGVGQSSTDEAKPVKGKAADFTNGHAETENYIGFELQSRRPSLDQSPKNEPNSMRETAASLTGNHAEIENFMSQEPLQEGEDTDWSRAEHLCKSGSRGEVEMISCSTRGFVASFGSLIGFLPYRNLGAKWRFLAFESWLRKKGLDPSKYRQNLGIVNYGSLDKGSLSTSASTDPSIIDGKLSSDMKVEDLLEIYDQEKLKFLSTFVGMRLRASVVLADRKSRKLILSGKRIEPEEVLQKRRSLMSKLNVGDVVKCYIKKITYYGILVEVEGVHAMIHQSEVSWDTNLEPSSFYKVGQVVDAKVHQLDFFLGRILLSLKEVTSDPLTESLESVVGERNGDIETAQADTEWLDVESLVKELEGIEGVQSVSKGRFFLSPGLAPTFQVYMASMFQNQYKLLARSENKVQEVLVQANLDKEEMKAAIIACTNKVE